MGVSSGVGPNLRPLTPPPRLPTDHQDIRKGSENLLNLRPHIFLLEGEVNPRPTGLEVGVAPSDLPGALPRDPRLPLVFEAPREVPRRHIKLPERVVPADELDLAGEALRVVVWGCRTGDPPLKPHKGTPLCILDQGGKVRDPGVEEVVLGEGRPV